MRQAGYRLKWQFQPWFGRFLGSDLEMRVSEVCTREGTPSMADCEDSWVEGYYDTLSFFYWEPQHIGRKKYADPRLKSECDVQQHVRTMEVTLNHQIKQFLCLAPAFFRNRLFKSALGREVIGNFTMARSEGCKVCAAVQPDFLFTTDDSTVSLEMKIGAKSSITQVLKYALLALAVEKKHEREMDHSLIFLGADDFSRLWRERFSEGDLRQGLESRESSFIQGLSGSEVGFRDQEFRFAEIVSSLSIGFISYNQFANLLYEERPSSDRSAGEQVYRKLIDGMTTELKRRKLAQ
jgi:hypothetical protein